MPSSVARLGPFILALLALALLVIILLPIVTPQDPRLLNLKARSLPASQAHWLGTDSFGRDVLSTRMYRWWAWQERVRGGVMTVRLVSLALFLVIVATLLWLRRQHRSVSSRGA